MDPIKMNTGKQLLSYSKIQYHIKTFKNFESPKETVAMELERLSIRFIEYSTTSLLTKPNTA